MERKNEANIDGRANAAKVQLKTEKKHRIRTC